MLGLSILFFSAVVFPNVTAAASPNVPSHVPSFAQEIVPTFYKLGCNAGECHGSFSGKGNFRLSLFAADAEADHLSIHDAFDRRIDRQSPADSLLLKKPTMGMPHGGGLRLRKDSPEYALLLKWIEAGAKTDHTTAPRVTAVEVDPPVLEVAVGTKSAPLRVTARFSDGTRRDVSSFARFESLDASLAETDGAVISTRRPGDTHILAHYAGQIGYANVLAPVAEKPTKFPAETLTDSVDRLIVDKLRRLHVVPADLCSDNDFLRRVYLDVVGRLPSPDEVRRFTSDKSPNKRSAEIDRLLVDPLHAAVWANKMCDAMGADNRTMYDQSVYRIYDWMRNRFERNIGWDQIVRGALTGSIADDRTLAQLEKEHERIKLAREAQAAANAEAKKTGKKVEPTVVHLTDKPWRSEMALRNTLEDFSYNLKFRVQAGPRKGQMDARPLSQHVATAFLGVRLECAECHKHPHDRWSQQDFFSFTAAFSYLKRGVSPEMTAKKLTFINGVFVTDVPEETFLDPKTGEPLPPRALGGPVIQTKAGVDPRLEIWKWMVAPENPYFARAMVNRVWAHYFGRGLIEPVDALSEANPPSHPEVMDALVADFRNSGYDLRRLHRRILNTRSYQRDWMTNASNADEERNYSHRVLRRMPAEFVLDALADVTGTPIKLDITIYGGPGDDRTVERAIDMPLSRPRGDDSYVLKIFDKPLRTQSCDCERSSGPNLSQALFLYNDTALTKKIADPAGRLAKLLKATPDDDRLLDELYLLTLARLPNDAERTRSREHLKSASSRTLGFEDLFWSLLNRREFLIIH
ncbi:MAG: DUF1549 and DUF1553 domain-containing protein [Planctomycetia bacterium]|nr:DUF1549 and DUF1553 domain-containing protein [Planctomycetia bacterium]